MTTGAEQGEIAEVGSPVLVPPAPIDAHAPLRWTTVTIATAAALLALANAGVLGGWVEGLPSGPAIERARPWIARWEDLTAGLGAPRRWLHDRWQAIRGLRFGAEQPGEDGAAGS